MHISCDMQDLVVSVILFYFFLLVIRICCHPTLFCTLKWYNRTVINYLLGCCCIMLFHMLDSSERWHSHMNALHRALWFMVLHCVCGAEWEATASVKNQQETVIAPSEFMLSHDTWLQNCDWWCNTIYHLLEMLAHKHRHTHTHTKRLNVWAYQRFPPALWWVWGLGGLDVEPHRSRCPRPGDVWGSQGRCSGWMCRLSERCHSQSQWRSHLREEGHWPASWSEVWACHQWQSMTPTGDEYCLSSVLQPESVSQDEL